MEKDLTPDIIKATQLSLGKYVKRPPLSEKLLKKPPFRFLHDIVIAVLKNTGFFKGLFEDEELISDNVKDKDSKILFLNKVISVLSLTTEKTLLVKPSKIVAGQEPDKTNELLQCLAYALDNNLSSDIAVKKYRDGMIGPDTDRKSKNSKDPLKKSQDIKKLSSKSSELTQKKEPIVSKSDNGKGLNSKNKSKVNNTIKNEPETKKALQQTKTIPKKAQSKKDQHTTDNKMKKDSPSNKTSTNQIQHDVLKHIELAESEIQERDYTDAVRITTEDKVASQPENTDVAASYSKIDNELNSTLSSQDLMEVEKTQKECMSQEEDASKNVTTESDITDNKNTKEAALDSFQTKDENMVLKDNLNTNDSDSVAIRSESVSADVKVLHNSNQQSNTPYETDYMKANVLRPTSVRPLSSRPGAPRPRDKNEHVFSGTDNILTAKVNIIEENLLNEEEDSSIILMDPHIDATSSQDVQEPLQSSLNEHGHLVQQILESQKELSQATGKTEIEWQFGAQKTREALNREIEQLRYNVQGLSHVANPLGKLLDHIQEDVEVMRQELLQWTKIYNDTSTEFTKLKTENEDSLLPLRTKLKQLDVNIEEKHYKINDLKIVIHKNSSRIDRLLSSGKA